MEDIIRNLKDPAVIARIQNWFGVVYIDSKNTTARDVLCSEISGSSPDHRVDFDASKSSAVRRNSVLDLKEEAEEKEKIEGVVSHNIGYEDYVIKNKIWYYIFLFGTYLGDELGYAVLFPLWLWNVDSYAGRRVLLVWSIIMYIGQTVKDVVQWPRPAAPPVIRLQKKWSMEYGMPSTHAMVGVTLPAALCFYSQNLPRVELCVLLSVLFCALISFSRLYLGMHSVLDVLVGIIFCILLLIPALPLCGILAAAIINYHYSPIIIVVVCVSLVTVYPTGSVWTPTRGDTAIVLATCTGVQTGYWAVCNFGTQIVPKYHLPAGTLVRPLIGYMCVIILYGIFAVIRKTLFSVLRFSKKTETRNKRNEFVNLMDKYITYSIISFFPIYIIPQGFQYLGICRNGYFMDY